MTNKPMLSVERELLDSLAAYVADSPNAVMRARSVQLRALLDEPSTERKPFAWYRVPKDFPLQGAFFPYIEGQSEGDIQNSLDAEFGFNVKRLYDEPAAQHQGELVAKYAETVPKFKFETLVEHCKRLERQLYELRAECNDMALYKENAVWFWQHDGEDYLQSLSCPVVIPAGQLRELLEGKAQHNPIAEQPAPVAVVMPKRRPFPCSIRDVGFNEALDAVARLNGIVADGKARGV